MQTTYIYPVLVERTPLNTFNIHFPNFPGILVTENEIHQALKKAREHLVQQVLEIEEKKSLPPIPATPDELTLQNSSNHIIYLDIYMPPYRDEAAQKSVSKNCTMPKWLRDASEHAGLNFSLILQSGLKEALGLNSKQQKFPD
ncbi:type II toxin-antitoxin system HicB family antitoxin [Paenibacillus sp. MMS18-CY102]|uniref:type II toxin-antitoxin system HicB family antitoxin n=1 Tax=Paenibacillus sp. MMS18-CY102 TaxID=2682849 RepID=UPI001365B1AA|nr:type II toxin-antitoxin system HicB family antitoxin [Paenibacillus sp. MMS18-CY102]MWC26946.1 type II toxin-antitoxin system HicB family antitoxin [Paenibacillus sp. MMS18-CY102]